MVIPTLNEAADLPRLLAALAQQDPPIAPGDVTVSDSGSSDATRCVSASAGCRVLHDPRVTGRGTGLRVGVEAALAAAPDAAAVWMLHADCLPPAGAVAALTSALDDPSVVGGAFGQRFNAKHCSRWARHRLRFVMFCNRLRYRLSGVYFGDQGIFARPDVLVAVGGVPDWDLFEDVELVRRLRGAGRVVLLPQRMSTSPRRFLANGCVRQLLRDTRMLLRHRLRGDGAAFATDYARRRG